MTQEYIGTSGWSYPTGAGNWKGVFYPPRLRGEELAYYAERFPAVEVNATFYRVPAAQAAARWAAITPDAFRFAVKLYRKFTHPAFYAREEQRSPEILPEDVTVMRRALDALAERGKLAALLVQYPDFFFQRDDTLAALSRVLRAFRDYPLAVELRNRSWDTGRAHELLGEFRAARVRVDDPLYANLDAPSVPGSPAEYWRFHGRNAAAWRRQDAGQQRYDYLYTPAEIDDLAEGVRAHAHPEREQYVFFNNHPGGQAAANAVELAARLKLPLPYRKFHLLGRAFPAVRPLTGTEEEQLALDGGTMPAAE